MSHELTQLRDLMSILGQNHEKMSFVGNNLDASLCLTSIEMIKLYTI